MPPNNTTSGTDRAGTTWQTISNALKVRSQIKNLDTSVEELSSDIRKQAQALPRQVVADSYDLLDAQPVDLAEQFEGEDYRDAAERHEVWLRDADGQEFDTDYREAAEKSIAQTVALNNAWRQIVSGEIASRIDTLPPRELGALRSGEYYRRPEERSYPNKPSQERDDGLVPGSTTRWLLSILLAVAIPVIAAVMGWNSGGDTAEEQTLTERGITVVENAPFDPLVFNVPIRDITADPSPMAQAVEAQGPENAETLREIADDEVRSEQESTALIYARNAAIVSVILAVALFIVLYSLSKSRRSGQIMQRNNDLMSGWKRSCAEVDRNNEEALRQWQEGNDAKVDEIVDTLSRRLGFDLGDETIFSQWSDYDYMDYAGRLRSLLDDSAMSLPTRDEWLPLSAPELTDRWYGTPLELSMERLSGIKKGLIGSRTKSVRPGDSGLKNLVRREEEPKTEG